MTLSPVISMAVAGAACIRQAASTNASTGMGTRASIAIGFMFMLWTKQRSPGFPCTPRGRHLSPRTFRARMVFVCVQVSR
ncbi:MAG: hypothetical protein ACRDLB_08650 [Actinomycetota bacterium]